MSFSSLWMILPLLSLSNCVTTGLYSRTGFAAVAMQTEAGNATSAPPGDRHGKACSTNVLGIVTSGDSSIDAARKSAQISHVATVDFEYLNVLGLYGRVCTVVSGQ